MFTGPLFLLGAIWRFASGPEGQVIRNIIKWLADRLHLMQEEAEQQQRDAKTQEFRDAVLVLMQRLDQRTESLYATVRPRVSEGTELMEASSTTIPALRSNVQLDPKVAALLGRPLDQWSVTDIVSATGQQRKVEADYARHIEERVNILTSEQEMLLNRLFVSKHALAHYARVAADQQGILVLPTYSMAGSHERYLLRLREVVDQYNIACVKHTEKHRPAGGHGDRRFRVVPPLVVASDLLAPGMTLTPDVVSGVRAALAWLPTICIQVTIDASAVRLGSWCWLRADDATMTFSHDIPLSSLQAAQPMDDALIAGISEIFLLLLGDALSVGGYEGVSVLTEMLRQSIPEDELRVLRPWYASIRQVFGMHYGPAGLIGVPEDPLREEPALLAWLRRDIGIRRGGSYSPRSISDNGWLFLAVVNRREYLMPLYVLAIKEAPPEQAEVRCWKGGSGAHLVQAGEDEWLHATSEAVRLFRTDSSQFTFLCRGVSPVADLLIPK